MKKILLQIYSLITIILLMPACSAGWLDLEPSAEVPVADAVKDFKGVKIALNGVYNGIKGTSDYSEYYAAGMIYYGDVKADDVQVKTLTSRGATSYRVAHTANTLVPDMWYLPYRMIDRVNNLLEIIESGVITDAKEGELENINGQLYMARALGHFDLLKLYSNPYDLSESGGKYGVPIITETHHYTYRPQRNTINETYKQILDDLALGEKNMKGYNGSGYFNTWTAKALMARVYLYMGDYENAYKKAKEVIDNGPHKLWTTEEYLGAWGTDPVSQAVTEALFEIKIVDKNDWTDRNGIAYLWNRNGYADFFVTKKFYDFINKEYVGDVRLGILINANTNDYKGYPIHNKDVIVNKYPGTKTSTDFRVGNIIILRLSEQYLIASEAALKLGRTGEATTYLNEIVLRGNPKAAKVKEADISLDRILQERRVELVGEGHRLFDLFRNNLEVKRTETVLNDKGELIEDIGWHVITNLDALIFDRSYYRAILPIPNGEISANPIIAAQQNPGY